MPTGSGYEFGVDPNEDPELALALRVSMEEQRARQEAENASSGGGQGGEGGQATTAAADQATASATEEDDPVLARALAMSVGESGASSGEPDLSAMTEDEAVKGYLLDAETHLKFLTLYKEKKFTYDF